MSSLQDIMNVDEDQLNTQSDKGQISSPTSHVGSRLLAEPSLGDQLSRSAQTPAFKNSLSCHAYISPATASSSGRGRRHYSRWPNTTSSDLMESYEAPGNHCSSSSAGDYYHPGTPMTPFNMSRSSASAPSVPVKLTPITGRVSRAKKGVPVHTCTRCRPPKVSVSTQLMRFAATY